MYYTLVLALVVDFFGLFWLVCDSKLSVLLVLWCSLRGNGRHLGVTVAYFLYSLVKYLQCCLIQYRAFFVFAELCIL